MVNVQKLRGKIAENGYNITTLSEKLGLSRNTFATYLVNPCKMPLGIATELVDILCDDKTEAATIFFADDLRNS